MPKAPTMDTPAKSAGAAPPAATPESSYSRPADAVAGGCSFSQRQYLAEFDPAEEFTSIPGFIEIDPTDLYCYEDECYTIIGNVYVYMDNNHVTGTYSRAMAPELAARIEGAMGLADSGKE